jgi:large subunit ribosomal protein L24
MAPKHPSEVPIPLADLHLVIPYEITQRGVKRYSDVIVESVFMERHTTGIDPYTGTDYGSATIPEDHQRDPQTGLPIFHRYIAGTQHRIEWPWEREEEVETSNIAEDSAEERKSFLKKTFSTLRHPITSLKSWREQKKAGTLEETKTDRAATLEQTELQAAEKFKERPRSVDPKLPEAYDMVDTTRNIVEGAPSMSYTLVAPPFPNTLAEEIRSNVQDFKIKAKKDKEAPRSRKLKSTTEQSVFLRTVAKERKRAAESMKTPMQLRWELEHAKKVQKQKKQPLVQTEALLMALGQHMKKNGVKIKRRRQATEDVD